MLLSISAVDHCILSFNIVAQNEFSQNQIPSFSTGAGFQVQVGGNVMSVLSGFPPPQGFSGVNVLYVNTVTESLSLSSYRVSQSESIAHISKPPRSSCRRCVGGTQAMREKGGEGVGRAGDLFISRHKPEGSFCISASVFT